MLSPDDWIKIAMVPAATGLVSWFLALTRRIATNAEDLALLKAQMGILWGAMEATALGALHHKVQPEMDTLLEGYALGNLSIDQLRQFRDRLKVIASGESNAPEQVNQAALILVGAEKQLETRLAHPEVINAARQALSDEADRRMAELTAAEARHKPPGWMPVPPGPEDVGAAPGVVPPAGAPGVPVALEGTLTVKAAPEGEGEPTKDPQP